LRIKDAAAERKERTKRKNLDREKTRNPHWEEGSPLEGLRKQQTTGPAHTTSSLSKTGKGMTTYNREGREGKEK